MINWNGFFVCIFDIDNLVIILFGGNGAGKFIIMVVFIIVLILD